MLQAMATLLVFTRFPEPGVTKTRLIGALGAEGAARLQQRLTAITLDAARAAAAARSDLRVEIRFAGGDARRMGALFGDDLDYCPQGPGDLGQRLTDAFDAAFARGEGPAAAIGSDCPDLTADFILQGLEASAPDRCVLGPAADGGYTFLALARAEPSLFAGVDWGTERVFRQTRIRAERAGLAVHRLAELADVDRPEDLSRVVGLLEGG